MAKVKRVKNYEGRYFDKLTPASTMRFGSGLIGMGIGSSGGVLGMAGGFMIGSYIGKKANKKLFKIK